MVLGADDVLERLEVPVYLDDPEANADWWRLMKGELAASRNADRSAFTLLVEAAADELGVHPSRCVMIGDTGGDVEAALSARADVVLVPTGRTRRQETGDARARARVAATLSDAVSLVLKECQ